MTDATITIPVAANVDRKFVQCECGESVMYRLDCPVPQACPRCMRVLSTNNSQFQRG